MIYRMVGFGRDLQTRLRDKQATVGVIGLGYVGLPICLAAARSGLSVIGFDIDDAKPRILLEGRSYLHHIPDEAIAESVASRRFTATSLFFPAGFCSFRPILCNILTLFCFANRNRLRQSAYFV